jgi:thiol:disulfide interchange protein DsbC
LVNKSEARRDYQRKTLINNIDQDDFITFKPDLADYKVYVFTDVDCGYCRQFHNQIDEYLNLGIQVNYLAYPRAGLDSESYEKISSAWCDEDPQYSLTLLKQGKEIDKKLCSNSPVEKHFKLGQAIGVQGTPSIVTEDGRMIPGYLPPQELLNILDTKS